MARIDSKGNLINDNISTYTTIDSQGNLQFNPNPTPKKKKKNENTWFDTGALSDGYDFGDVTKTILGTAGDIGASVLKGVSDTGLGIAKAGVGGIAMASEALGNKEYAEKLRNRLAGKDEEVNKRLEAIDVFGNTSKALTDSSVLGNTTESILSGVGNYAGMAAAQSVGIPWQLTAGLSSAGAGLEEAYKNNASDKEAWISATVDAGAEILSEYIFGGLKLPGTGKTTEKMLGGLTKKISNKVIRGITEFGINAAGEGLEEIISGQISAIGKKLTYMTDKELNEIYSNEDKFNDFIAGALSTVVANGVNPNTYQNVKAGRSLITNYTNNEQDLIDSLVDKIASESGQKKSKVEESVKEDLENGEISLDDIEKSLGGARYNQYQAELQKENTINEEIKKLEDMKATDITVKQQEKLKSLREQLEEQTKKVKDLGKDLTNYVYQNTQNDELIQRSYNEYFKKGQKYEIDPNKKYSKKQMEQIQKAMDSGLINNTRQMHLLMDNIAQIHEDKDITFNFMDSEQAKEHLIQKQIERYMKNNGLTELSEEQRNAFYKQYQEDFKNRVVNGFVENGEVFLNVDSPKYLNAVMGHEITHLFEDDSKLYKNLRKEVLEFAKTKEEYKSRIEQLGENYKEIDSDLETELVNDIIGDYLFTDEEFVRKLSKNKNIFQKIYDEIKYLAKVITGRKEQAQLQKVKNMFDKVYREIDVNQDNKSKYMIASTKGMKNAIKYDPENKGLKSLLNEAKRLKKEGKSNEDIRKKTWWFQDSNKKWVFEISDKDSSFIKRLEKDKTYKLGDIFKHDDLFELYPSLKNQKVRIEHIDTDTNAGKVAGVYNVFSKLITLESDYLGKDQMKKTLLHELQHRIQSIEGLENGNTGDDNVKYFTSLGEIATSDVEKRKDMTYKELMKNSPEISKNNPIHQVIQSIHNNPNSEYSKKLLNKPDIAELYNEIYNNGKEGEYNREEIFRKGVTKNISKTANEISHSIRKWINNNGNNRYQKVIKEINSINEELDNSSFSYDNQGRTLSKQQQEFFKDSKVRDENGNLLEMYHGTPTGGFNIFNNQKGMLKDDGYLGRGFYFTNDKALANEYSDAYLIPKDERTNKPGEYGNVEIKEVYLNIKNPYIVPNNIYYDENMLVDILGVDNNYQVRTKLESLGYDGIIYDNGVEVVAFEPNQIKNVNNTNPTTNNDIRYSISDKDNTGRELSREQREFFKMSKATDEKGNLEVVYHGSQKAGFTKFNRNFNYYTNNENVAQTYSGSQEKVDTRKLESIFDAKSWLKGITNELYIENNSVYDYDGEEILNYQTAEDLLKNLKRDIQIEIGNTEAGGNYEGYINITNPLIVNVNGGKWSAIDITGIELDNPKDLLEKYGSSTFRENGAIRTSTNDIVAAVSDAIDEGELNFDGIIFKNIRDEGGFSNNQKNAIIANDYITFNSNQFKAVDNLTPTSDSDIRYSISENDNKGRTLSNQQRRFFNNSKLVDNNSELKVMYNGGGDYTTFDNTKMSDQSKWGKGIYLTESKDIANMYGDNVKEVYANITNPINQNEKTIPFEKYNEFTKALYDEDAYIEEYDMYENDLDLLWDATNKGNWADYGEQLRNIVGVDGLIINDDNPAEKMAIAFNSNQIKNVDNLNPTDNEDIRMSISNKNEDIAPMGNYRIKGEDVKLQDIAPIETNQNQNNKIVKDVPNDELPFETENDFELPFDYEEPLELNGLDDKTINKITKNLKSELSLNPYEVKEFKNVLSDISKQDNITKDKIYNLLEKKFGEKEFKVRIDEIADIKNQLKNTKIFVPDYVKVDIPDYSDFRQRNYGKINFSKEGMAVDKVYDELAEMHPEYFDKEISNEADQLQEIARVANLDKYITDTAYLDESKIENAANWIYDSIEDYNLQQEVKNGTLGYDEYLEKSKQKDLKKTRSMVQNELQDEMNITINDLEVGKDISSLGYQRTDPIRLNEKVFGAEIGKKINDATIRRTNHNEAERTRFLNKEREEIANLGIKARSKESAAVQKYGEKQYINDKGELLPYGDVELAKEFSDTATQDKIKNAARVLRNKYDVYIDEINKVITDMGYDPIPKRPDYMRHFQEINDKLSEWGVPLNRDSLSKDTLPTDINGITDQFKPGKNWFASAMQRKGLKTTYDAITGIDGYLEGASNLIYHTGDIQRYRTLSKMIRDTYGQSHGLDNVDLDTKEGQQRLNDIMDNKLSKYAAWLDEQANSLAGKKGGIDRAAERLLGRKIYTIADTAKKQVGSNMTGFNVRSALTNFASAVQGASKTNKLAFLKGTISTIKNMISNDGLIDKSDFLTNRFGSDTLSKKLWQKASNAGQILMTGTDYFTANQIWRSKYYENLSKGMNETEAIKNADDFASRIMGDRSKGMTAELFNSKTLGLLTQFQLEVNNQWSSIVHDNKMDVQRGNKSGATVLFQLGQLAAMSYLFNNFMKSMTGSDVMLDPLDILKELFGWNDDEDEETSLEERSQKVLGNIVNNLPFASFMTGGRIPISEAFTGAETAFKKLTGQKDNFGNEIKWEDVKDDVISSGAYWLLPTGYGQIRKTTKGMSMYDEELPLPGSYTNSGNLRFTADDTTGGKIKAALFGEYSSKEAQEYRESGYETINAKNIDLLKELGMNSTEFRKFEDKKDAATGTTLNKDGVKYTKYTDDNNNTYWYNKNTKELYDDNFNKSNKNVTELNKVSSNELLFDYISNSYFSEKQKQALFKNYFTNATTDQYGYEKYQDNNKKTYWYDKDKNVLYDSKYNKVSTSKLDNLNKVSSSKDMSNYKNYNSYEEADYAIKNPEKYATSKLITNSYSNYKKYTDDISKIESDKDASGKTISNSKKRKVFEYINNLNEDYMSKVILFKMYYPSDKTYNTEIFNYLNNLTNLSLDEKKKVLKGLGATITEQGTVRW